METTRIAEDLGTAVTPTADWRLRWPEPSRRRLAAWMWAVALTTCAVVVVGGVTRLTRSGLSIVEWQPVAGVLPPLTREAWEAQFRQYQQFPEFQQVHPTMTLDQFKRIFFWEYLHRLLARAIGVVFLVPAIAFWRTGDLSAPLLRRVGCLFGLGMAQGAMGWLMVRSGLVDRPSVSHYRLALHLSLAFAIFGAAVWLARELAFTGRTAASAASRRLMGRGLAALGLLLSGQILWGAFVAGLRAGYLFNTFPLMGGALVPAQLWLLEPAHLNLVQNAATVQWIHRLLGTALLAASWVFFLRVGRARPDRRSATLNRLFAAAITFQYGLGVATLVLGMPLLLAGLHQVMALTIVGLWIVWIHHVRQPGRA